MVHNCRIRGGTLRLLGTAATRKSCRWAPVRPGNRDVCSDTEKDGLTCAIHRLHYEVGTFHQIWPQPGSVYDLGALRSLLHAARLRITGQSRSGTAHLRKSTRARPYAALYCQPARRRSTKYRRERAGATVGTGPANRHTALNPDQMVDCICSKLLHTLRSRVASWKDLHQLLDAAIADLDARRVVSYSLFWGGAQGVGFQGMQHSLAEYAYGLWCSIPVAAAAGWVVRVYHDGSVDAVLARFWATFPATVLQTVRVILPPDLRGHRYAGCFLRLLAADDPHLESFVMRDLDDPLDANGLRMVADRWLPQQRSGIHIQSEAYHTPQHRNMVNMGWYGQRNAFGVAGSRPAVTPEILRFLRRPGSDHYCADSMRSILKEANNGPHSPRSSSRTTGFRPCDAAVTPASWPSCPATATGTGWKRRIGTPHSTPSGSSRLPGHHPPEPGMRCWTSLVCDTYTGPRGIKRTTMSRKTGFLRERWPELSIATSITIVGAILIGWGAHLMTVLPKEGEETEYDAWWTYLVKGTDGNTYDRKKVIHAARIMMVVSGCILIVLAWILPIIHMISAIRG